MRPAVERLEARAKSTLDLGRPTQGGMWGRWFCIGCNGSTGRWDDEYIRLHRHLIWHLHHGPDAPRQKLMGTLAQVDVGAFARAMWAWSFALVPSLLDRLPDVAAAVRTGDPVDPPDDLELLLGITMSRRIWLTAQPDAVMGYIGHAGLHLRPSGLLVAGPTMEALPIAVVASPPFNVVLAHKERPNDVPHCTTNEWLLEPAGRRRDVTIDLPLVDVEVTSPLPVPYASLRPARAEG